MQHLPPPSTDDLEALRLRRLEEALRIGLSDLSAGRAVDGEDFFEALLDMEDGPNCGQ